MTNPTGPTDEQLAAVGLTRDQWTQASTPAAAAAPVAQPYAGPPGAGQLSAPLPPPPAPEPPKAPDVPHPDLNLQPGEIGVYEYHRNGDKPGTVRQQAVMVTHTDPTHVWGLVLGELQQAAQFLRGELTRHGTPPQPPAAAS